MGHGSYGRASESHELNFQHCQEKWKREREKK
jgi:hypothetical protein